MGFARAAASLAADVAVPAWLSPFVGPLLIAATLGIAWLGFSSHYESKGYDKAMAEVDKASAAYVHKVAEANADIGAARGKQEPKIAASKATRRANVKRTEDAINAHPDYAAVRIPNDVYAERVRALDAVTAAAANR